MRVRILFIFSLLFIGSCGQWDLVVEIPFIATWQGKPVDCSSESTTLTDLRFYVSNPQLLNKSGEAVDVRFATEYDWQNDAVALIDLENGEGSCMNGTSHVRSAVIGVTRADQFKGLRFTIGVPFRVNHEDPSRAEPPLNNADMHSQLNTGYKFLRAGIRTETDGFWIHAVSAGCEGTVGYITGCDYPNRIEVYLPDFVPGQSSVRIELAELLNGIDLTDSKPNDCSSEPSEETCVGPFAALGIDFVTGKQAGSQRVFSVAELVGTDRHLEAGSAPVQP